MQSSYHIHYIRSYLSIYIYITWPYYRI